MQNKLEIVEINHKLGVLLSEELLLKLRVRAGDAIYAEEMSNGIELRNCDPKFIKPA